MADTAALVSVAAGKEKTMNREDIKNILSVVQEMRADMKKYDDHPLHKREKDKRHIMAHGHRTEEDEKRILRLLRERGVL